MNGLQGNDPTTLRLGEAWIKMVTEKDFERLSEICQPDVHSQMLTPHHVYTYENVRELTRKVEQWFSKCDPIQKEQSRVMMVGEKLAIFYRLSVAEDEEPYMLEQQLYCTPRDGQIAQLSLLCSGFQPIPSARQEEPTQPRATTTSMSKADAWLSIDTGGGQESTCAILTPAIKRKLKEINSGQVLEVRVDDPAAREDIEAWCRLSGNTLLNLRLEGDQELHFYLMKK